MRGRVGGVLRACMDGKWRNMSHRRRKVPLREAYFAGVAVLEEAGNESPRRTVEELLGFVMWRRGRQHLLRMVSSNENVVMTDDQMRNFKRNLSSSAAGAPLQYIIGEWDFHDLRGLKMEAPVFIPRPETETLVNLALGECQGEKVEVLDIGTGSGSIGLAILHALPQARCTGLDILPTAIQLSTLNAHRLGLGDRWTSQHGAVENAVLDKKFHITISNPPYIPTEDMSNLDERVSKHESAAALCGGADGLQVVRAILSRAPTWLMQGGTLYLELNGAAQVDAVKEMTVGVWECTDHTDLRGVRRFLSMRVHRPH